MKGGVYNVYVRENTHYAHKKKDQYFWISRIIRNLTRESKQ